MAQGERALDGWLAANGHRGPEEFDLAAPRWRERPADVEALAAGMVGARNPLETHRERSQAIDARLSEIRATLPPAERDELDRAIDLLQRYLPFREDGKHYLMLGYELLRDVAREAGRRLKLGEDVVLVQPASLGGGPVLE